MISNGVFKTIQAISVFFFEQSWSQDGLGISPKDLSFVTLLSYFPSLIILMGSPKVVPKYIGYKSFIRVMCLVLSFTIFMIPFWRDVFSQEFLVKNLWIVYLNIILMYCFNPKIFSPFINFVINNKVPAKDRTSINSITFIGSTLCSSIFINFIGPIYSISFSNSFFLQYYPYNKYLCFALLTVILILGQAFMADINLNKKL